MLTNNFDHSRTQNLQLKNRVPFTEIINGVQQSSRKEHPQKDSLEQAPQIPQLESYLPFLHLEVPIGDPEDVQDVAEYEHIVYRFLRNEETHFRFEPSGVIQTDINSSDRGKLIDWLSRVNYKCQLKTNTLYLAIGIIDRVIAATAIKKSSLKLLGAVATLLASKIEDVHYVKIDNLVLLGDHEYTKEDMDEFLIKEYRQANSTTYKVFLLDTMKHKYFEQ